MQYVPLAFMCTYLHVWEEQRDWETPIQTDARKSPDTDRDLEGEEKELRRDTTMGHFDQASPNLSRLGPHLTPGSLHSATVVFSLFSINCVCCIQINPQQQ